ncbi:MAG: DNA polymerase IV [Spirochaetaceae bacterium]|jgi:DNA polymerase-4|nr:DNA polymerase IV [Spirochaetaceae bacterium]
MKCFIHADLDAFYASVEQLDNEQYRGKPVIVGGLPEDRRAVVSTASYEARKYGVHAAMPMARAYELCPDAVFLRGDMARYKEKSREVMGIFSRFTPDVRQISIDEAFLDITGTERLFGPPSVLARKLKRAVHEQTGLTVSVGSASNRYVAKIASGMSKPDGFFVVENGAEEDFMRSLPVSKIWGAGGKAQGLFKLHGLKTCTDIHKLEEQTLCAVFGKAFGAFLYRAVRGKSAVFDAARVSHSISAERTFEFDMYDEFMIETELMRICGDLMRRLLDGQLQSRTFAVKIRYNDFSTESAQETAAYPIGDMNDLFERVCSLFRRKRKYGRGIRLIGAGLMNLEPYCPVNELFSFEDERKKKLERCIHEINKKFPKASVKKARLI